jgi:hypothetical protein
MKKDKDLKGIYFEMRVGGENPKNFGFLLNVLNRFDNLRDYNIIKMEVERGAKAHEEATRLETIKGNEKDFNKFFDSFKKPEDGYNLAVGQQFVKSKQFFEEV